MLQIMRKEPNETISLLFEKIKIAPKHTSFKHSYVRCLYDVFIL